VVLLGSVVSGFLLIGPTAASAGSGIRFHAPVTLPGSEDGNEPSLAISNDGVRYPSWQSPGEFAKSSDGVNFVNIGIPDGTPSGT